MTVSRSADRADTGTATPRPGFLPEPGTLAYRRFSLAALFAIPLFLIVIHFSYLSENSNIPFLIAVGLAGVVCVLARRVQLTQSYALLLAFSVGILAASLAGLMPDAWTRQYSAIAAIRHWLWMPLLTVFTTAFIVLFWRLRRLIIRHALVIGIGLLAYIKLQAWLFDQNYPWQLYIIDNEMVPVSVALIIFIFRQRRDPGIDALLIAGYFLASGSSSHQLLAMAMMAIRFWPREKWVVLGFSLSIFAILLISPQIPEVLDQRDANAGVRAIMWGDSIDAAVETNGLGVGYGTEYIRNQFYAIRSGDWKVADPLHPGFLYLSTHSTFYDVLLRLGLVGILLSAIWIAGLILPRRRMSLQNRKMHAALSCAFIIFSAFNPALISYYSLLGMCTVLAWLFILARSPELIPSITQAKR